MPLTKVTYSMIDGAVTNVRDFGAVGDGVTNDTVAIQSAIDAAGVKGVVYLPEGDYLVSGLTINHNFFTLIGAGYNASRLVMDNSSAVALDVAKATSPQPGVEGLILQNFAIFGNANNLGGIKLGTASPLYRVAFGLIESVDVRGFTNATANQGYGILLQTVQEINIVDCHLRGNKNNLHRPSGGFCTSTVVQGMAGYIGGATNCGILIDDTSTLATTDFKIKDIVIESNANEAIKSTTPAYQLVIDGIYFENNHQVGGDGDIVIVGGSGANQRTKVAMSNCRFRGLVPLVRRLKLDYVGDSLFTGNWELYYPTNVLTNCLGVIFASNRNPTSALNVFDIVTAQVGAQGNVIDLDSSNSRMMFSGNTEFTRPFRTKQATAPTIAAGSGASTATLNATATDIAGVVTAAANSTGANKQLAVVTFNEGLGQPPIVFLQSNQNSTMQYAVVGVSSTKFEIYAENTTSGTSYEISYFVVGKN